MTANVDETARQPVAPAATARDPATARPLVAVPATSASTLLRSDVLRGRWIIPMSLFSIAQPGRAARKMDYS